MASGDLVYFMRHGTAEGSSPAGDFGRELTPEGRLSLERRLQALLPKLAVKKILASPLVRAQQTAEILSRKVGVVVLECEALASGASSPRELLALAAADGDGLALIGHNPEIGEALSLVAGRELAVAPGTLAAVRVDADGFTLAWLDAP